MQFDMTLLYLAITLVCVAVVAWILNAFIPAPLTIKRVINVVLGLMVVGMVLWLINSYVPMAGSIRAILNIVVVVATCVGVLQALGLWAGTVRLWHHLTTRAVSESPYHEPGSSSSEHIIYPRTGVR